MIKEIVFIDIIIEYESIWKGYLCDYEKYFNFVIKYI